MRIYNSYFLNILSEFRLLENRHTYKSTINDIWQLWQLKLFSLVESTQKLFTYISYCNDQFIFA